MNRNYSRNCIRHQTQWTSAQFCSDLELWSCTLCTRYCGSFVGSSASRLCHLFLGKFLCLSQYLMMELHNGSHRTIMQALSRYNRTVSFILLSNCLMYQLNDELASTQCYKNFCHGLICFVKRLLESYVIMTGPSIYTAKLPHFVGHAKSAACAIIMYVRLSVRLSVCHTRESRLIGSCHKTMSLVSWGRVSLS